MTTLTTDAPANRKVPGRRVGQAASVPARRSNQARLLAAVDAMRADLARIETMLAALSGRAA